MNSFSGQKWGKKLGHAVIMMNDTKYKSTEVNASKLPYALPCLTKLQCKLTLNLFVLVKKKQKKLTVDLMC